jgi:hypothetical protein
MVKIACIPGGPGQNFLLSAESRARFPRGAPSVVVDGELEPALDPKCLRAVLKTLAPDAHVRESILVVDQGGKQIRYLEVL